MKSKYKPCPKCKSEIGYQYVMWTKYNQWIDLDGEPVSAQDSLGKEGKIYTCINCRERFREKTLLH